jgi:glutamine synthetase
VAIEQEQSAHKRLEELLAAGVKRVRVHYADLLGTTRAKVIPIGLLEEAVDTGLQFCIAVFAIDHTGVMPDGTGMRDELSFRDMQVLPDLETLRVVPWERETAICIGDCWFDGAPLPASPRGILKRAITEAQALDLRIVCGHELEFFLLRRRPDGRFEPYAHAPGLVYRMDPRVDPEGVVRAMEDAVRDLGLPFICTNQEYDPSQWEINCRHENALEAADDAHLLKLAIKEIAAMNGLVATFIGRPVTGGGTSGYHLHISAWDGSGTNAFEDQQAPDGLSDQARWFVGGLLEHARGMTAVMAPTVNAYKRFIAQELAPYWVNWGPDNRSVYARIPLERGRGTRVECRGADGAASAYLSSAAAIFAGIDGIERQLDPGPPESDVYGNVRGGPTMPFSLAEALDALENDPFMRAKLGEQFLQAFVTLKRTEARRFSLAVTDWELDEYAEAL